MTKSKSEKITRLEVAGNKPDARVVEALEDALTRAKSGEMLDVVIYGSIPGNSFYHRAAFNDGVGLIGVIEVMKNTILRTMSGD